MKPFLRKASFPVLYFLFLPGALLHTSTDHVQNSSYTLPLTLLKSSFSALQNIILSTFLLMQLQRQSVRVMKESIPCELLKFSLSTRHYIPQHMDDKDLRFIDDLLPWSPRIQKECPSRYKKTWFFNVHIYSVKYAQSPLKCGDFWYPVLMFKDLRNSHSFPWLSTLLQLILHRSFFPIFLQFCL